MKNIRPPPTIEAYLFILEPTVRKLMSGVFSRRGLKKQGRNRKGHMHAIFNAKGLTKQKAIPKGKKILR